MHNMHNMQTMQTMLPLPSTSAVTHPAFSSAQHIQQFPSQHVLGAPVNHPNIIPHQLQTRSASQAQHQLFPFAGVATATGGAMPLAMGAATSSFPFHPSVWGGASAPSPPLAGAPSVARSSSRRVRSRTTPAVSETKRSADRKSSQGTGESTAQPKGGCNITGAVGHLLSISNDTFFESRYSVELRVDGTLLGETATQRGGLASHRMQVVVAQWCELMEIRLRARLSKHAFKGRTIGSAYIPVRSLVWFCGRVPRSPLRDKSDVDAFMLQRSQPFFSVRLRQRDGTPSGYDIIMHLDFFPAEASLAMAPIPPYPEIMWPSRHGNHVSMYADAVMTRACARITGAEALRDVKGRPFVPRSLWRDIHRTLSSAQRFIYICGWSVWPELRMVREGEDSSDADMYAAGTGGCPTASVKYRRKMRAKKLADMLIQKAEEGVQVRVMVWDEFTSTKLTPEGVMSTHDEEVEDIFQNTKVVAVKVKRKAFGGVLGPAGHMIPADGRRPSIGFVTHIQFISQLTFSHHQKCIICDIEPPGGHVDGRRAIAAFVGGVDLTDGRYDTAAHPLFSTAIPAFRPVAKTFRKPVMPPIDGPHGKDFHNASMPGAAAAVGDPRQPWHDIHARVVGPVARDVLRNFTNRWNRQVDHFAEDGTPPVGFKHSASRGVYRDRDLRKEFFSLEEEVEVAKRFSAAQPFGTGGLWHCALIRSTDASSAVMTNPVTGKPERLVDSSFLRSTIHAIRRARRFIYIENQYFIGASDKWRLSERDREGAPNTIPTELVCRIIRAIRDGDAFHVYVVIPLWPEGDPHSGVVQEILSFQHSTVEYMYKAIHAELTACGLKDRFDPGDYFTLLATCQRELVPAPNSPLVDPAASTLRSKSARRCMLETEEAKCFMNHSTGAPLTRAQSQPPPVSARCLPGAPSDDHRDSDIPRAGAVRLDDAGHAGFKVQSVDKLQRRANVRRCRRFPIYVHSKLLIVDDDVITIGSE